MSLEAFIFPPSPFSRALLFFMEDTKIDYDKRIINLRKGDNKTDEYKAVNPTLKTPAIREGSFCMGETTSILRYLADREKCVYSCKDPKERANVDFWLEFTAQNIVPFSRELVWQRHLFPAIGREASKELEAKAEQTLSRNLKVICEQLAKHNYICEHGISLADFLLTPAIEWHLKAKIELGQFPGLSEWLTQMTSRPSWNVVEGILNEFLAEMD